MDYALNRKRFITMRLLAAAILLLAGSTHLFAFNVTVDSTKVTGSGNYRTLNEALTALNNKTLTLSSTGEDTIYFSDSIQRTYPMTQYVSVTASNGLLRFMGRNTDPDKFAIISRTGEDYYSLFTNVNVQFERLTFTGSKNFQVGTTSKQQAFRSCVIRDFTSSATSFLQLSNNGGSQTVFENCLVVVNKFPRGLVDIQSGSIPIVRIYNCTFHADTMILSSSNASDLTPITIKNCVFSANPGVFTGPENLKTRVTNSFVPSDAFSATSNKIGSDPRYMVPSGKIKPSDWRLADSSLARDLGDTAGTPKTDMSGGARTINSGKIDAGCWDILDGVKITVQPKPDTIIAGEAITFTVTATGTPPIKYWWYKAGIDTPLVKTDSLKLSDVPLTMDSTLYYCVVSNAANSVTSSNALLRVIAKPVITDQPDTSDKFYGDTASFSVAATGGLLKYSWYKNDVVIPNAQSMLYKVPNVAKADSGALYSCVITNDAGTVTSIKALLKTSPAEVKVTEPTADLTLMEGEALALSVKASGRAPLVFEWKKAPSPAILSQTSTYTKAEVTMSDSGTYRCYVSNGTSKDSAIIKVRVTAAVAPRITAQSDPKIVVKTGSPVNLTLAVSGAQPFTYRWYKGTFGKSDSIGADATYTINSAAASDSGTYFCIVSNTLGKDTTSLITLNVTSGLFFNPLTLSCSFVDLKHVKVTIGNFRDLPVATSATYADTIGIWYEPIIFPAGTLTKKDTNCILLPLAPMLAKSGNSYDTLITVKQPDDECRTICFIATPLWHAPDTIIGATATAHTDKVYLCDSTTMENNLKFNLSYTPPADSVVVKVTNLTSINRDSLLYVVIDYTLGSKKTVQTKILPADLPAKTDSTFTKVIKDYRFTESEDTLTVNVYWRGILGNTSNAETKKTVVGKPRPVNTATLAVDSTTSSAAYFSWQFLGARDFDSIRIYWSMQTITPSTDLTAQGIFSKTIASSLSATALTMLFSERDYYAALQVIRGKETSLIPQSAITTFKTKVGTNLVVDNSIKIIKSSFLAATNEFQFTWAIDTLKSQPIKSLSTGIVWSKGADPEEVLKITKNDIRVIGNLKDTNTVKIDIGTDISFSTTFHFAFMLGNKLSDGWAFSTDSSRCTVATTTPEWQKIHYFPGNDTTVTAFNGAVQLTKIGVGTVSIVDTLLLLKNVVTGNGFVAVSNYCVDFKKDSKSDPIRLTMHYDTVKAAKIAEGTIRMYQYSAADTSWSIITLTTIDTVRNSVSAELRPNEFPKPFMLLCDTLPPVVSVKSDTITAVDPGKPILDTIQVTDNITNSQIAIVYWGTTGKGGSRQSPQRCTAKTSLMFCSTPADSIISDRSLKTEVCVSDGVHEKVIDLSRVVNRTISDPIQLSGMKWTPVTTTSTLNDTAIEAALSELSPGESWEYDPLQFRIFQWADTASAAEANKTGMSWLEYRNDKAAAFTMRPGKVIWVKSRKNRDIKSLGTGTTIPVRNPYQITLKAKQWTDIALPYRFDVRIGDVFTASNIGAAARDSLLVYNWKLNDLTNIYVPAQKYVPNLPGSDSLSFTLTNNNEANGIATYTILNNATHDVTFKIPPLPESFSSFKNSSGALSKKQATAPLCWSLAISAATENGAIPPVLCGNNPESNKTIFPAPPAHSLQRLFIGHDDETPGYGVIVDNNAEAAGSSWGVSFVNEDAAPATFDFAINTISALPHSWKYALFHPETGKLEILRSRGTIKADGNAIVQKTVLVGDSAFIASYVTAKSYRIALVSLYPNPCRGNLTLQLTLPGKNVQKVIISLYDQLGRRVSHTTLSGKMLHAGLNTIKTGLGNAKNISSGTYILQLKVVDTSGKTIGTKKQRLLYMP